VLVSSGRATSTACGAGMRWRCMAAGTVLLLAGAARPAPASTLYSVTDDGRALMRIDAVQAQPEWTHAITGLQPGERIVTADGDLGGRIYVITDGQRLYTIDPSTVSAQLVAPLSAALPATPMAMDLNPVDASIRVITSDGDNFTINAQTGRVTSATRVTAGFAISAIAHSDNRPGAHTTTLYGLDAVRGQLLRIGVADGVAAADTGAVTVVGRANEGFARQYDLHAAMFDIATDGAAYAVLTTPDRAYTVLSRIDLTTGLILPGRDLPAGRSRGLAAAASGALEFTQRELAGPAGESGIVNIVVTRTGGSDGVLSARVAVLRSTATANADYVFVPTTLTFADGDTTPQSLPCTILDDAELEPIETVVFGLTEPGAGVQFGEIDSMALAIVSNDRQHLQSFLGFGINSPVSVGLRPGGLPNVVSYSTSASSLTVTGGTATNTWAATSPVRWRSDRGFSGVAADQTQPFAAVPHWFVSDIPLQPGINTLTFSTENGERVAYLTLVVTVESYTYSFAEGAAGPFFDTEIAVANPTDTPAPIALTYLTALKTTVEIEDYLAPLTRQVYSAGAVSAVAEAGAFAATVTSRHAVPLVVERTMQWGVGGYGSHAARAVDGANTSWYFAEGAQGFFQTFLLLGNPDAHANAVTVDWLREGAGRLTTQYTLPPRSRTTIIARDIPGLANMAFGIKVTFARPGIAERAMYFGDDPVFAGGHATAGVPAPATSWLLAEGSTGEFFDTFILLLNPNPFAVSVVVTFFPTDIESRVFQLPAESRLTLNLETLDPRLRARANVSALVQSHYPIVAERAQYWPGHAAGWHESHVSFGGRLSQAWAFADGRVGGANADQTYLLLLNPSGDDADVGVTFHLAPGTWLFKRFAVPARTRLTVAIAGATSDVPEITNARFWIVLDSSVPISAERSTYSNDADGMIFSAGAHVVGAPLR
jgi:Domain of unknown function (DUF4394)/Calx-beta domain